jgi:hypothetical protein
MQHDADALAVNERKFLEKLQRQAISYFIDNQAPNGLVLDRQRNHGPRRIHGLCSTAATGMGFFALALASAEPYRLLSYDTSVTRLRAGLQAVLDKLPQERGVVPHFVHSATDEVHGSDHFSTVETAWVVAGALWAASFLKNRALEQLADQLYERVDWHYWSESGKTGMAGLLRHGKDRKGNFLPCNWDRLNGETAFMYVLAAGAEPEKAIADTAWTQLQPFYGTVAGHRFNNADLGLFVFQYGLDLLDLEAWRAPGEVDLLAEAKLATQANHQACKQAADTFATYRRFWGLSPGDGPGDSPEADMYRCYTPLGPIDGTAHLTATVASVMHDTQTVLGNLQEAEHEQRLSIRGRYGFSNVNLDSEWVGQDMVGIDAGAAVLALDNFLIQNRVREVFQRLPSVRRGLERLRFRPNSVAENERADSPPPATLRAAG